MKLSDGCKTVKKGTPVPFLFHRVLASVQLPEVPCRSCVRPPSPRSGFSPTLRSERFKGGSSPKHITTLDNRSDTVIAFEGFMDFLAYLSLKHPERLRIDAAVLNSVVNLSKAIPFLSRHPVIHAFFDNDEAGRKTTSDLIRLCPRSEVIDQRHFYSGHKDVNDYLIARIKGHAEKLPATKNISETKAVQALRNNLQALKAETAEIEPPRRKGVKI